MARIRSVKPSFFTSQVVATLPFCARLTFVGLWTYADDDGRGIDDARLVKAAVWPLDDNYTSKKVEADLALIEKAGKDDAAGKPGLIVRYEVAGRRYLAVTNWTEHQRTSHPKPSTLPPPPPPDDSGAAPEGRRNGSGKLPHGSGEPLAGGGGGEFEGGGGGGSDAAPLPPEEAPPPLPPNGSPPATPDATETFAQFWKAWPPRAGKKCLKADAVNAWRRMKPAERALALAAAPNYAQACEYGTQGRQDAVRWLTKRRWTEFDTPPDPPRTNGHARAFDRDSASLVEWANRDPDDGPPPFADAIEALTRPKELGR